MSVPPVLEPVYTGWATHQQLLLPAIADLGPEQLALRPAPDQMAIWQLTSHMDQRPAGPGPLSRLGRDLRLL